MKREFLESLGVPQEAVDKIMAENGRDIESAKSKFSDYEETKARLKSAEETLEKFSDYDQTKADVEKYKAEAEKIAKESAAKIAAMERSAKIKDFLSGKKFVNEITRDAIGAKIGEMLETGERNLDEIFAEITKDKTNILQAETPTPPVVAAMGEKGGKTSDDAAARAVMGLSPKKD